MMQQFSNRLHTENEMQTISRTTYTLGVVNVYLTSRFFQTVHLWKLPAPPSKIKQH